MKVFEVITSICSVCLHKSGQGTAIEVVYGNTGGYSPGWEGCHCLHLTPKEILEAREPKKPECTVTPKEAEPNT